MNYALLIETTSVGFALGLVERKLAAPELRWYSVYSDRFGAAQYLADHLADGIRKLGITPDAIKEVVVGTGPGSFTGIKIGVSFATGFYALQNGTRFYSVSSLEMYLGSINRKTQDSSKRGIAIKATKAHGFCALLESNNLTSFAFNVDDKGHEIFSANELASVGSWDELKINSKKHGVVCNEILPEDYLVEVLKGMTEFLGCSGENEAMDEPPAPNYMKMSTAEERILNG